MTLGFVFLIAYIAFSVIARRQERQECDDDSDKKDRTGDEDLWCAIWYQYFNNNGNIN